VVNDVRQGSPAWDASLGIATTIVAVNDRAYSTAALVAALDAAAKTHAPVALLVRHGDVYRTISLPYYDGPRYPHLERLANIPDRLSEVVKPRS
jgi:hypothetical protein